MSQLRRKQKQRVHALLGTLTSRRYAHPIEARSIAAEAHALSTDIRDPLLSAEAALHYGRLRCASDPEWVLGAVQQAERVFRANGLPEKANDCIAVQAWSLFDLGQEHRAIAFANRALADPSLVQVERAYTFMLLAKAHDSLGDSPLALRLVDELAIPAAERSSDVFALARARCAKGLIHLRALVTHRTPELWAGLPGGPEPIHARQQPEPKADVVLSLFESARQALPASARLACIDILRSTAVGLCSRNDGGSIAVEALAALARQFAETCPHEAAWALFCRAIVLRHHARLPEALACCEQALALAEPLHQKLIVRGVLLQLSFIHEVTGDAARSLAAFKRLVALQQQSSAAVDPASAAPAVPWRLPNSSGLDAHVLPSAALASESSAPESGSMPIVAEHLLRNLEPVHVKRALRFIEEKLCTDLSVGDVVRHCGVSRRSLEVAFKDSKASTIAVYIKRRRLDLAATQLLHTDRPISEISPAIGYLSPSAFSREFRARFGVTPTLWRRQQANL